MCLDLRAQVIVRGQACCCSDDQEAEATRLVGIKDVHCGVARLALIDKMSIYNGIGGSPGLYCVYCGHVLNLMCVRLYPAISS